MERNNGNLFLYRKRGAGMTKKQFLDELRSKLVGLPKEDVDERISFYEEMINDRMDEGKSEEQAVSEIGTVDEVIKQIARDTPLMSIVKHKMKPKRRLRGWEIVIIILGFPFWFPIMVTAFVLMFVGFILMWTGAIVTYAVETSLIAACFMSLVSFFLGYFDGTGITANLPYIGMALMCFGGAIGFGFACFGVTKGMINATRGMFIGIKSWFIRKGDKK